VAETPEWGDRPLVVLAGAGISAPPPSDLPSWWGFNQAVLDGIRRQVLADDELEPGLQRAIDSIELDSIGVALFSQVVYSAFAGSSWFELVGHLDGTVPNQCHDALAGLAAAGRLAAIVTTNFDTLIERAFADRGVPLDVELPSAGTASEIGAGGVCTLIKVHGSANEAETLVDLANQKARGVPPTLRARLARAFAEHPVLVLGFSGADLGLGEDYIGLGAAAPHTPWLRWATRGDRPPLDAAQQAVDAVRDGTFVAGELPALLEGLGVPVPPRRDAATRQNSPGDWVDDWLGGPHASPEASMATCARLLMYSGEPAPAAELRAHIRRSIERRGERGLDFFAALYASQALALSGSDEIRTDPAQALGDLRRSRELMDAVTGSRAFGEEAKAEQAANRAGLLANIANAHLALGELEESAHALGELREQVERLEPPPRLGDRANAWLTSGTISRLEGNSRRAMLSWRSATNLALAAGAPEVALHALENRWRTAFLLGEVHLARALVEESEAMSRLVPGGRPDGAATIGQVTLDDAGPLAVKRLAEEVEKGGERLDEVLFMAWSVMGEDPALRDALAACIDGLPSDAVGELAPEARALLRLARYALSDADYELLDGVAQDLLDAAAALASSATNLPTEIEARLHPELRAVVEAVARGWAQAGVTSHTEGAWSRASVQLTVGATAFALAGAREEATRAYLYLTDGMRREGQLDEAESMLGWLESLAPPALSSAVVAREVGVLLERVAEGAPAPGAAIPESQRRLERLRLLGSGPDLGAALVAAAQIMELAGDPMSGLAMATEAVWLLEGAHAATAQKLAERLHGEVSRRSGVRGGEPG
jgi:tetratricopeptide (TPR) repeat protein